MTWTRRKFSGFAGASLVAALGARAASSQTKAGVVVIGGGIGGATVAKYLATSTATLDVTLVEPKQRYTTCFFSNLYLAGVRSLESLTHDYETLARQYGIKVIHDTAAAIDPVAKKVALAGGAKLSYCLLYTSNLPARRRQQRERPRRSHNCRLDCENLEQPFRRARGLRDLAADFR